MAAEYIRTIEVVESISSLICQKEQIRNSNCIVLPRLC